MTKWSLSLCFALLSLGAGLAGCSPKESREESSPAASDAPLTISGEAFYRERIAAPPGAVFEVFLEDVSKADAPATLIGSQRITDAGQPPYRFSIEYLPSDLIAGHRLNLRAQLRVNDQLWFATDQAYPVLVDGKTDEPRLLLLRTSSSEASSPAAEASNEQAPLLNTHWKLTELHQREVSVTENQREPHVIFTDEGRVHGSDGCNNIGGGYQINGEQLEFTQMISTMMACPPSDNDTQPREFTASLEKVKSYRNVASSNTNTPKSAAENCKRGKSNDRTSQCSQRQSGKSVAAASKAVSTLKSTNSIRSRSPLPDVGSGRL